MTNRKKKSIEALQKGVHAESKVKAARSMKDLFDAYLRTDDKRQRERMLKEFVARRLELVEYLDAHPEVVTAEARIALMSAASGGRYTDTKVVTDERGRQRHEETTREAAPNIAALEKLLSAEKANQTENNLLDMLRESMTEGDGDEV